MHRGTAFYVVAGDWQSRGPQWVKSAPGSLWRSGRVRAPSISGRYALRTVTDFYRGYEENMLNKQLVGQLIVKKYYCVGKSLLL